jgi:heme A synthase
VARRNAVGRRRTRWVFAISAALFALYALNIALGMAAVKLGFKVWRLGDVGEFLLVLTCMTFFVAGLVADEEQRAGRPEEAGDPHTTEGGEQ